MKRTRCIYTFKDLGQVLVALMGLMGFCCSEDFSERGDEGASQAKDGIQVTVATKDIATRALGTFEGTAADNELIHSCVVAFVKEDGTVAEVKVLDESQTGVESKDFNVILSAGEYKAYAFANITTSTLIGLKFTKDASFGDVDAALYDVDADNLTQSSNIPMSGYLTDIEVASNGSVKIGGVTKTEVTITVVRMVGKLEFQFTNNSASDITVTELSFKPGASGNIKLLPTWGSDNKLASPDMTDATVGQITKAPSLTLNTTEENKNKKYAFYVREVVSNHPTGHFPISIKYKKGESETEETMTALLYDLTEINRNDWIRVPITLTDYKLKLDVEFYPPIGGYPPVDWEDKDDEYYVRFATGGWFSIEASVVNKADGTEFNTKNVEISIAENGVSNTSFFRKQPAIEASGELTGEIKSGLQAGDSSVVTIQVKVTDTNSVETTFTRKIHFIYKNKKAQ